MLFKYKHLDNIYYYTYDVKNKMEVMNILKCRLYMMDNGYIIYRWWKSIVTLVLGKDA